MAFRRILQFTVVMIIIMVAPRVEAQTTTCLPTCSTTDGRFLSLAGSRYKTLAGDEIAIELAAPSGSTSISFDIFDGETSGVWDGGTAPLVFKLFCDSLGDGSGTTKIGEWQGDIMSDSAWFSISMTHDSRALAATGRYFYILKVRIAWGDDTDANNVEDDLEDSTARNTWSNFKIRSTSTMSTNQFSFCAPLFSTNEARIIYPNYPLLTSPTYDGTWNLYINSPDALSTLEIWDGDMDFGSYNGTYNDSDDPNTSSGNAPRWSGTCAVSEGVAVGTDKVRDVLGAATSTFSTGSPMDDNLSLAYRRAPSVIYQIVDPNGKIFYNNNPSGNLEWEKFTIGTQGNNSSVDTVTNYLPSGIYQIQISGMDLHNINSWRYSSGIVGVTDSSATAQMPDAACVDPDGRRISNSSQSEMGMEIWPDGAIYMWGENGYGQLGDGTTTYRTSPVRVLMGDYSGTSYFGDGCNGVIQASPGHCHSLAILNDGSVYSWGHNDEGQLGINSITNQSAPKRVLKGAYPGTTYIGDDSTNMIVSVFGGLEYSVAVSQRGQVYAWGDNLYRQLGDSTTTDRLTPIRVLKGNYPGTRYLGDDATNPILQVCGGQSFSMALAADGTVYTWGTNGGGQLGDNTTNARWVPVRVLKGAYSGTTYLGDDATNKVIQIAAADSTGYALTADGTVYSWGNNSSGQLGNGNTGTDRSVPVRVIKGAYTGITYLGDSTTNKITSIHSGGGHALAVSTRGRVYAWGRNQYGQLGDNTTTTRNTPVLVLKGAYTGTTYLGDGSITMDRIGTGRHHSHALGQDDNKTFSWGWGSEGRLGHGATTNSSVPVLVNQGARPAAKVANEVVEIVEAATPANRIVISGIGVYPQANQVYMTLDAIEPMEITIDIYTTNGVHVARPVDHQSFTYGRQRFGVNIPGELFTGKYLMKVWSENTAATKSFVLSR